MSQSRIRNLEELFRYVAKAIGKQQLLDKDLPEHVIRQRTYDSAKLQSLIHRYLRTLIPYLNKEDTLDCLATLEVMRLIYPLFIDSHTVLDVAKILAPFNSLCMYTQDTHEDLRNKVLDEINTLMMKIDTENIIYRA